MRPLVFFILFLLTCATSFGMSKKEMINLIRQESIKNEIDPNLAIAIALNESHLNPKALGSKGEIGIFQLRPEYHKGNLWNPKVNIRLGIKYLSLMKRQCYDVYGEAYFVCFNTGPNRRQKLSNPRKFQYYVRVRKHLSYTAMGDL